MLDRHKQCSLCRKVLPATREFFSPQPRGLYDLHSQCRPCVAARAAARYRANPEKLRKRQQDYRKANPEREKANQAAQWARHAERFKRGAPLDLPATKICPACKIEKPLDAEYYNRCSGRKNGFYPSCKECARATLQDWRSRNVEKMRTFDAASKAKREASIMKRLMHRFGVAVRSSLVNGAKRRRRWETLVGYTVHDLRRHIERQFSPNMSWENYGCEWHIDHILPISSFKFERVEDPDFLACWALSNLRPLPVLDNLSKNARRIFLI